MKSHLIGSTSTAPSTSAVNYNSVTAAGAASWNTTESLRGSVIPHATTIDQLRVSVTTAPSSGKSWAITLMVNGSASALTCTISDTATSAQDTTHTVSLSAGDYVSLKWEPTGTPTGSGTVYWNMRQDATDLFAVVGSNIAAPTSGTNYMSPQSRTLIASTDALGQIIIPTAGTLKNLYFWSSAAPGVATGWTLVVYQNGSPTLLTCAILGTATSANDVVPTDGFAVSAGDRISVQIATTGTPTARAVGYSMSFDPTTDGESFLAYNANGNNASTGSTSYNQPIGGDTTWNTTESNRYTRLGATTVTKIYGMSSVSPGVSPRAYTLSVRQEAADPSPGISATINDASTTVGSARLASATGTIVFNDDDRVTIKSVPSATAPIGAFVKTSMLLYIAPAGNVTVTPGVATLVTSAFAPLVNLLIATGLASLSLSTFAPAVAVTSNQTVTPSVTAVSITPFSPTATATANVVVVPSLVSVSLTAFAPTVAVTDHKVVTPDVLALSTSGFGPSVVVDNISIPGAISLTLTTFAPAVSVSDHITVTPSVASVSLSTSPPTVATTDNQLVIPGVLGLVLSSFDPTVLTTNGTVTPQSLALSLTAYPPTIASPVLSTPGTAALTTTTYAPVIGSSITTSTATLGLSTFAPTIVAPQTIVPPILSLVITSYAPHTSVGPEPGNSPVAGAWLPGGSSTGSVVSGNPVSTGSWLAGSGSTGSVGAGNSASPGSWNTGDMV